LLPNTTAAGAANVSDRIAWRLEEWNKADNLEGFRLSVSIGTVEWRDGQSLDEILDTADRKMYEQKNAHQIVL
jgi:GGDEF domain-containing protein